MTCYLHNLEKGPICGQISEIKYTFMKFFFFTKRQCFRPWYFAGDHPSPTDGIVTRTACLPTVDCKNVKYEIQLLNCEKFTAYYLKRPRSCDQAYCFGKVHMYIFLSFFANIEWILLSLQICVNMWKKNNIF